MADTLEDLSVIEDLKIDTDNGDHDKFSHYVRKEDIVESSLNGTAVIALCGKVWTPNDRPDKFPVCPECKDIYEGLEAE